MSGPEMRSLLAQSIFPRIDCRQYAASQPYREIIEGYVQRGEVGGFVLFDGDVALVASITSSLNSIEGARLLFAADCEDGVTMRFSGGTEFPSMMALGSANDVSATYAVARSIAREMLSIGLNWNFAPVADINTNPDNPIINIRSFGETPDVVEMHVAAYVRGMQDEGVIACAKHFPGHGDTEHDSHIEVPVVRADRSRLEAIELRPFRNAIAAGVKSIMVSHVALPSIDATGTPATLSRVLNGDMIRETLGFSGVIVSDALDMNAITALRSAGDAAVEAYLAGCDVLETLPDPGAALDALVDASIEGTISPERITETAKRIGALREFASARKHSSDFEKARTGHDVIALESARRSIRTTGTVPRFYAPLFVLAVADETMVAKAEEWFTYFSSWYPGEASGAIATPEISDDDLAEMRRSIASAGTVIAALFIRPRGYAGTVEVSEAQRALLELASARSLTLLNFGNPYALQDLDLRFRLDAFSSASASLAVSIESLAGGIR